MTPPVKVWVTRDETPDGPLCAALAEAGLEPVLEPVVGRIALDDGAEALRGLSADDWLVVTSAFVLKCLDLDLARRPRVAAVGPGTADAARARGLRVEMVGEGGARDLYERLRAGGIRARICHPRSRRAPALEGWPGATVIGPVVYDTVPRTYDRAVHDRADVASLCSPSAVEALGPVALPVASIGGTTSAAVRARGLAVWVEAESPTFAALAAAIARKTCAG